MTTDPATTTSPSEDDTAQVPLNPDALDVLILVDRGESSAQSQRKLADAIAELVSVFEDANVDYRIAALSADDIGMDGGTFVSTTCRSREADFVPPANEPTLDAWRVACTEVCPPEWEAFTTLPSESFEGDRDPMPRPWIERNAGGTNLPDGLSPAVALQCLLPQGTGNPVSAPLDALRKALDRGLSEGHPESLFFRPGATVLAVIVTERVDCSGNHGVWPYGSTDGAECWQRGVACTGTPPTYDSCEPQDIDAAGKPVAAEDADELASLVPVREYTDYLAALLEQNRESNRNAELIVALIAGATSDGEVQYAEASAPDVQASLGIGPGCSGPDGFAAPPVRLRSVAEQFTGGLAQNIFSVCDEDYGPALSAIADAAVAHLGS